MHASVRAAAERFLGKFEGLRLPYMYLDHRVDRKTGKKLECLVTCATGNLIDPIASALVLPWRRRDGGLATNEEKAACWHLVKARQDMTAGGGVAYGKLPGNTLRLDVDAMTALFFRRLDGDAVHLRKRFPDYEEWPADAQLAVHSMAWALGPAWDEAEWPKFTAALRRQDWMTCSEQCDISSIPNTKEGRNAADMALFLNAFCVSHDPDADTSELVWPVQLNPGGPDAA